MRLNILVMERSVSVRDATVHVLTLCNCESVAFGDAATALDALNVIRFDAVVTGMAQGDLDVPKFVNAAKSVQPSLLIVVGSGYRSETAYPQVVDSYVDFPCSLDGMRSALLQALERLKNSSSDE
jgi:DNA-binding NtrC family response regulator